MFKEIQERLWIWRPAVLLIIVGLIVFAFLKQNDDTNYTLLLLKVDKPIKRIELKFITGSDREFNITERSQLDSIGKALYSATEKNSGVSKSNDIRARAMIYKADKKFEIEFVYSEFTGWLILAGNSTLTAPGYLFELVGSYAGK